MKIISKNLLIVALIFSLFPVAAFAREDDAPRRGGFLQREKVENRVDDKNDKRSRGVAVCENIDAIAAKITSDMTDKSDRFDSKKEDRMSKLSELRNKRDDNREENRGDRDAKHDVRFDALMAKADTDAERDAVKEFEATFESATKVRREAIDAAVKKYREGVDKILKDKLSNVGGDIEAFKKAMDEAIEQAKEDCAEDIDPKPAFMEALRNAREAFKTSKPEMIKDDVKALAEVRKAEIEEAVKEFKDTMSEAYDKLKEAFGGEID